MSYRHIAHQRRSLKIYYILLAICTTFLLITPCAHAEKDHRPRIGLVLGGGGARGIAHVGVLQWLETQHIPIDCIAGTSMGAIVGGAYAAGMTPHDMARTLQKINWPAIFTDGPTRADLPPRAKQKQRALISQNGVGMKDGAIQLPKGLINGQNLLLLLGVAHGSAGIPQ